jgi:RNA polymerase sigma-70 factor, ECF subfamily
MMSMSEPQPAAKVPTLRPDDRDAICLSGLAPDLAPAHLPEPSEPESGGKAVYAVRAAMGRVPRNGKVGPRIVEEDVSDELLLRNVAEGDKAAMHIMFARYRETVFRFVKRIVRNPAIADDLVSQVFLDVWRSAKRFENRSRVSTWLLSIARFKALNALRGPKNVSVEEGNVFEIADAADTPDVTIDRKKTRATLRTCIEKLSPAHREIIDLIYYRDKSITEACALTGIPHATVKSRIFYARKQLARMLVGVGFELEAVEARARKRDTGARPEFQPHRSAYPIRERRVTCLP